MVTGLHAAAHACAASRPASSKPRSKQTFNPYLHTYPYQIPLPLLPPDCRLPSLPKARMLTFEVMSHVVAGFHFSPQQLASLSDAFDVFVRGIFAPVALAIPGSSELVDTCICGLGTELGG